MWIISIMVIVWAILFRNLLSVRKNRCIILKCAYVIASLSFFMQKLRTRIVGDLAGRLTPTMFKVSNLQIVNDWNVNEQKTSDTISISILQMYSFEM